MYVIRILTDRKGIMMAAVISRDQCKITYTRQQLQILYLQGCKFENAILDNRGVVKAKIKGTIPRLVCLNAVEKYNLQRQIDAQLKREH